MNLKKKFIGKSKQEIEIIFRDKYDYSNDIINENNIFYKFLFINEIVVDVINLDDWVPISRYLPKPDDSKDKYGRFWVSSRCPDEDDQIYYSVYVGERMGNSFYMKGAALMAKPIAWKLYHEPEPYIPKGKKNK